MVRKRVLTTGKVRFQADGLDDNGKRRRFQFRTEEQAKLFEQKVLVHGEHQTVGRVFHKLAPLCWPEDVSRDSSVQYRVNELIELIGAPTSIHDVGVNTVDKLTAHWKKKGNSLNTIANKLDALSKLMKRAKKNGIIPAVPEIERKRDTYAQRSYILTEAQEDAILNALPEETTERTETTWLQTGIQGKEGIVVRAARKYGAGVRKFQSFWIFLSETASRGYSECMHMTWQDCDFEEKTVTFRKTKTNRPRSLPMSHEVEMILRENASLGWEAPWSGLANYHTWRHAFDKAREAAGLPVGGKDGVGKRDGVVAYTARHTTATRLVKKAKYGTIQLMDTLGHTNPGTSARYIHLNADDKREGFATITRNRQRGTVPPDNPKVVNIKANKTRTVGTSASAFINRSVTKK
jgi:integrase